MSRRCPPTWLWVLSLLFSACERDRASEEPPRAAPLPVDVFRVERVREARFQPVAGTVRPFDRAVVAARVSGRVVHADFTLGQSVAAGDVVLELQADELQARAEQAAALFTQATRDATREEGLFSQGASTGEAALAAQDRMRAARAALDEARTLVSYTRVTAPFPGSITKKWVNTGDFAAPGTPLFEIEARTRLRVHLAVPENLPPLPLGASIRVLSGERTLTATLTESALAVDPQTRSRSVIAELAAEATIDSGDFVRALWPSEENESLLAPLSAVSAFGQIERVFVVADGKAVLRIVRSGERTGDRVQIVSGLRAGEMIVATPPPHLRDGQPLQPRP